ncbi:hypothetical protein [Agrococcus sp. HG114]|uniref:hypothetical protein n=1 Tax=Agrococcus sp. HG114 TaxID=2969757 RepID=UPI00215A8A0D|nr:hypothetical protein [Agrococcus sp. HG114]MCR8670424.1 hypothetical protein [Agrococcus sp. HG114]
MTAPSAPAAHAASASQFDPGNLISDANFFQGEAMSAAQVQSFLQQRRPSCDAGYVCLPDYRQATPSMPATEYCQAMGGMADETAASIIARVGAACDISQRVLLVLLEKEQSLVTDANPTQRQYDRATGFACPDTAPCDPAFGGFFYQVYNAARQFQRYAAYPLNYNHRANQTNDILYHPQAACGSSPVYLANQATAGLYNYTPYQPNAAALANLYGTGDACSAYGNRNFWRIFTDWFGDPRNPLAGDPSPFGALQSLQVGPSTARLQGFAIDPSAGTEPVELHLYVDGRWGGAFRADRTRADIGAAYPQFGSQHAFDFEIMIDKARFQLCLYAIDIGPGENTTLSCQTVERPSGSPIGTIDSAVADGRTAVVAGWAIDPDTAASIDIHAYVNGAWGGSYRADASRPDVGAAYYGYGARHGMALRIPIPVGTSTVCLFGINQGVGANAQLGCREVSNASGPPIGNLETATAAPGTMSVGGWALDPDAAEAIDVRITVDGAVAATVRADGTRNDVARSYPGYSAERGFSAQFAASGGTHQVCAVGVNVKHGADRAVSCRYVQVPGGDPFGSVDGHQISSNPFAATVSGWAIDPDVTGPVTLHAYVNGAWGGSHVASATRNDVGRAYPAYGAAHGYSIPVSLQGGRMNEVCVYGIDVGLGENSLIGCSSIRGPQGSPFGSFDGASVDPSTGVATIGGWVIDPDTPASADIHVYVDGRWGGAYSADGSRPDVGRAYPGYGSAHGFSTQLHVGTGTHRICVYGIDQGVGDNVELGCRTVSS